MKPGASIPMELLETACDINRHGFGVAYPESGGIHIERSIETNDPRVLGKLLTDLKNKHRLVHIRHATVGTVTMANNHPFVVLTEKKKKKTKNALVMVHNGTLWNYDAKKDKGLSDTYVFNDEFVRPLALRCEAFGGLKSVLRDELFRQLMMSEIKSTSRVLLMDSSGYVLTFNRSQGKDYEEFGFWAANTYSFDKNHNRSSSVASGGFAGFDAKWRDRGSDSILENLPWKETTAQVAEREAWMLEMTGTSGGSSVLVVPTSAFLDRAAVRRECAAAGALIQKRTQDKTRRM
jgi:predicted glutamine amidotransferase